MASPRPLDKDLYALRHRAQELSKGISKTMQGLHSNNCSWPDILNEMSVISSQLINIQQDIEKGIGSQLYKFMLQPNHGHFDSSIIGIKKMPQIVDDSNDYYQDIDNEWYKNYDEQEIIQQLTKYNRMLSKLDLFNAKCIANAKRRVARDNIEIKQGGKDGNEEKEEDGDIKMKQHEEQREREKIKSKYDKYLVEFMFCGQTPEQRARMASDDEDEFH